MNIQIVQTPEEKQHAFSIRYTVFVEEQRVPEDIEMDTHDETAIHFVVYTEDHQPIAASRVRFIDQLGKLERICVLQAFRGASIGSALIKKMEETIIKHGFSYAKLHAQTHAISFYERLGYHVTSAPFMDAGIAHVAMGKKI